MSDFIECNIDLHMHGLYSGAVSKSMIPQVIAEQAPLKGLDIVGSSDILNNKWVKLIKEQLKIIGGGLLEADNGTKFILQTEVEDQNRVHHIILFPNFSKVEEIREKVKNK
ncbi:MAG: phosphotransferase, partial [Nanoarchaeota archaeon]|nr:phosphotransferase [Nanoarchaeota archaeon]